MRVEVRNEEVYAFSPEFTIENSTFHAIFAATSRIQHIYTSEPLSITMLLSHVNEIVLDCNVFQEVATETGQAVTAGKVIQTLQYVAYKSHTFTSDPNWEAMYVSIAMQFAKKDKKSDLPTILNKVNRRLTLFNASFSPRKREISADAVAINSDGSERRKIIVGSIDAGYASVEEDEPYQRLDHGLAELTNEQREIIRLLLTQKDETRSDHERETAAKRYAKMKQENPEEVNDALRALYNNVYKSDNQDENFLDEDDEHQRETKNQLTITHALQTLEQLLNEHGGLQYIFNYVTSTDVTAYEEARPLIVLLHYLGYYHGEETDFQFRINEHFSADELRSLLVTAVANIRDAQHMQGNTALTSQLRKLDDYSRSINNGERITIPRSADEKLLLLQKLLTDKPGIERRITQPVQQAIVQLVKEARQIDQPLLHVEVIEKLTKEYAFRSRRGEKKMIFEQELARALVRLFDTAPYYNTGLRIHNKESSGLLKIIQHPKLSEEEKRLLLSIPIKAPTKEDASLYDLYEFIHTPDKAGFYHTREQILQEFPVNPRRIGHIAAILGYSSVDLVCKNSKPLGILIIGMRLGLQMDKMLTPEGLEYVSQYIQQRVLTPEDLEEIAAKANCSIQLLNDIAPVKIPRIVDYIGQQRER